jgi:LmbE family N-acetylglucosaminyl deacetylase
MTTTVLAIGAHPDDIELGCGGVMWRHAQAGLRTVMLVMTNGLMGPGAVEMRQQEARAAAEVLHAEIVFGGLQDGSLDASVDAVNIIERVLDDVQPLVIYTHAVDDTHQDHRNTAAAVLSAARNYASLLHYQSPSTKHFDPTIFAGLDQVDLDRKIMALEAHTSQVANSKRVDLEAITASAKYWGNKARTTLAEPFVPDRVLFHNNPWMQ